MTPKEKAIHGMKRTNNDKEKAISWYKEQIGKDLHPLMNPGNNNQEQIDKYWLCVIEETKKL